MIFFSPDISKKIYYPFCSWVVRRWVVVTFIAFNRTSFGKSQNTLLLRVTSLWTNPP